MRIIYNKFPNNSGTFVVLILQDNKSLQYETVVDIKATYIQDARYFVIKDSIYAAIDNEGVDNVSVWTSVPPLTIIKRSMYSGSIPITDHRSILLFCRNKFAAKIKLIQ